MESGNLAVVLALTLIGTAAMFLVIARQLRGRSGMATFAGGLALFGLVFAIPPAVDQHAPLPLALLIDAVAVMSVLLLRRGLLAFLRRPALRWTQIGAWLLGFVAVSAAAQLMLGAPARNVAIDLALALLFGWLALLAARETHGDNPRLKLPLLLLALVLGLLGALSLAQCGNALVDWPLIQTSRTAAVFEALLVLCALLLGPALLWMHTAQLAHQLDELAMRDPLTRLLNENGLDELLRRHFARRQHEPVTLMLIDVDRLARINARHGDAAGDDVLRMIGVALESGLRADDLVARVGGEEFVVGCIGSDLSKVAKLAERLRAAVAAIQTGLPNGDDGHMRCTVSIGLSHPFTDLDRFRAAWTEAEVSLQAAKDAGANCVVFPT